MAPTDRFCQNCGVASGSPGAPPAPAPMYPYYPPPPRSDHTALIVVLVVVVLLVLLVIPAVLYVLVSGLIQSPHNTMPIAIGVTISKSADGLSWILTFVSVPAGLAQNATFLALNWANGSAAMLARTFYQLEGAGVAGVRYMPLAGGSAYCSAGDEVLIAIGTGTYQYPAGTQYVVTNSANILAAGTLQ